VPIGGVAICLNQAGLFGLSGAGAPALSAVEGSLACPPTPRRRDVKRISWSAWTVPSEPLATHDSPLRPYALSRLTPITAHCLVDLLKPT